ncbi:hypothetical protein [Flammeovirga kamogawensis]|uniref:Porin family protein n=1 Tax=Flammeovirga kamogawensis TaxID=373891 RepID=A0ABX8GXA3_9BACT|nr:hypothetical protein [Flammeovirga kamogawensis]MBB6460820.1 hypothetical protein [Flammeovirga kamogawensis]QWG08171.1 hypothetical protein KM029_04325 [Flammeovirga kamogawensis]TRX69974.1 hypothetical protein EO216_18265 [Flammeovirga kamogawensis]
MKSLRLNLSLILAFLMLGMTINANAQSNKDDDENRSSSSSNSNRSSKKRSSSAAGNYSGVHHLNVGLASYWNHGGTGIQLDYEFHLAKDFTVAPSLSYASHIHQHHNNDDWRHSTIGLGARFRWYADRVLNISHPKWDVFASGDIGFAINSYKYVGDGSHNHNEDYNGSTSSPLWIGLGIGGKYHFNDKIGLQLIIGSGAQIGIHVAL